jgi:hypothetical protein
VKISKTCQVSFYQISPLEIRGEKPARLLAVRLRQGEPMLGGRGVNKNNPLYPPYSKGDIEGDTSCVLVEKDVEGVYKEAE